MCSLSSHVLKYWNEQGIIPGPHETESEFQERAHLCLNLDQELIHQVNAEFPFETKDSLSKEILQETYPTTQKLYGIQPSWIPVFFNNYQLAPWHGGCAWIFQLNEKTPLSAFLQLRAGFRQHASYLKLYKRTELLAHELAHVGRMAYEEPKFEEFLAYRSSSSSFRRWFGPILQSPKESLVFILFLVFLVFMHFALASLTHPLIYLFSLSMGLLLLSMIGFGLIRLIWRHWQINRCLYHLEQVYQNHSIAQHLLYRLQDQEIILFARCSTQQIKEFLERAPNTSFRWKVFMHLYPLKNS